MENLTQCEGSSLSAETIHPFCYIIAFLLARPSSSEGFGTWTWWQPLTVQYVEMLGWWRLPRNFFCFFWSVFRSVGLFVLCSTNQRIIAAIFRDISKWRDLLVVCLELSGSSLMIIDPLLPSSVVEHKKKRVRSFFLSHHPSFALAHPLELEGAQPLRLLALLSLLLNFTVFQYSLVLVQLLSTPLRLKSHSRWAKATVRKENLWWNAKTLTRVLSPYFHQNWGRWSFCTSTKLSQSLQRCAWTNDGKQTWRKLGMNIANITTIWRKRSFGARRQAKNGDGYSDPNG